MNRSTYVVAGALFAAALSAQNDPPQADAPKAPPAPASAQAALAAYSPQEGTVKVGTVAELKLAPGWLWLDGANGRRFLKDLGNRPGPETLGVAMPPDHADSHVFAVYSYADEGHVKDDEAPDYDALLVDMKEATAAESEDRRKAGVEGVTLLGWAEPPHYDAAQHKLFWAERLRFDGNDGETLNYNVRVLGRTGHLVVNGVGDIDQLSLVAAHNKDLLQATEFVDGKRYQDFDPAYDKVAAYGIGGLIAGKLALKVGLFAKLGVLLLKFLKPILVGVALLGALAVKIVGGRRKREAAARA
jgi:uncharacterized membrane-anchored protein